MNLLQIGLTPKQVSHHRRVDFSPSGEATRLVIKADSLATIKYGRNDDDEEAKGVVEDILLPHFKNDVEQAYAALVPIGWLDHCALRPERARGRRRESNRQHTHRQIQGADCHRGLWLLCEGAPRSAYPRGAINCGGLHTIRIARQAQGPSHAHAEGRQGMCHGDGGRVVGCRTDFVFKKFSVQIQFHQIHLDDWRGVIAFAEAFLQLLIEN
jgi:hypothetical protein